MALRSEAVQWNATRNTVQSIAVHRPQCTGWAAPDKISCKIPPGAACHAQQGRQLLCREQPAWQPCCPPISVGCKPNQPKLSKSEAALPQVPHPFCLTNLICPTDSGSSCRLLNTGAGCSSLTCLPSMVSGTSPPAIFWARPSATAVLPTPGSPIRHGLFLVRRPRIWVTRSISFFRPTTGSSLPCTHSKCGQWGDRHNDRGPASPAGAQSVDQLAVQAQELYGPVSERHVHMAGQEEGLTKSSLHKGLSIPTPVCLTYLPDWSGQTITSHSTQQSRPHRSCSWHEEACLIGPSGPPSPMLETAQISRLAYMSPAASSQGATSLA